jgi:hypothetical protein
MKKLFGGINLTWKKLIIFAIIAGTYTAIMALLPITRDTSFRDIAISFEWWILFGIVIISNSKSPLDSALKCFVFFLISQPLVYLIQVPFSDMGWKLFGYYRYWFYWTLACIPMGYIGYYINKKNWLSVLILSPMIVFLVFLGFGYINSAIESFPHHLLSGISCFLIIIVVVLNLFDHKKYKLASLGIALVSLVTIIILRGGVGGSKFETYRNIDYLDINLVGKIEVISFTAQNKEGNVKVVDTDKDIHTLLISGWDSGKYYFTIQDEENNQYDFEYYYDEGQKTILLNLK